MGAATEHGRLRFSWRRRRARGSAKADGSALTASASYRLLAPHPHRRLFDALVRPLPLHLKKREWV